ncbi:hypothetical protein A7U60_g6351 [Sanghuangporus baumii]|uniref:Oxidoreductase-like domain-containing protein n=1 Tax=Sanghuangporus baumii TaxID=108892 RepID=A0A9Q5HV65_SANBA|nr:hypothetical protein A7U60_g6351 [Sanghuangporus baumii]
MCVSIGSGAFARRFLRPINGTNNSTYCYATAIIAPARRVRASRWRGLGSSAYQSRGLAGSGAGSNATSARSNESLGISNKPWHLPPPPEIPAAFSQSPLERLKHPSRGGQDLANRYIRLERSLRGKEGYQREIEEFRDEEESLSANAGAGARDEKRKENTNVVKRRNGKQPLVFMGYTIPEAPKPPGPDGCAVCVHDLYVEALDAHESTLRSIRSTLHDKGVAEETWPKQLRYGLSAEATEGEDDNAGGEKRDLTGKDLVKARQASLSAFEQMELQLAAKQRAQEQKHTVTPSRGDLESDRPRNFVGQETGG